MASTGRRIKCNINERRVRRHNVQQANKLASLGALKEDKKLHEEVLKQEVPLEFPCKDSSKDVTDFRDWSYFKNQEKKKIVNIGNTHLWSKEYLRLLDERKIDSLRVTREQKEKQKNAPPVRSTRAQRLREHFSWQVSAAEKPIALLSGVDATADSFSWDGNDSTFGAKVNGPKIKLP